MDNRSECRSIERRDEQGGFPTARFSRASVCGDTSYGGTASEILVIILSPRQDRNAVARRKIEAMAGVNNNVGGTQMEIKATRI
jgi:hypothetical protein